LEAKIRMARTTLYKKWQEKLGRAKKEFATLGGNLTLHRREGHIALKYYDTDIVKAFPDGSIVLNSGGYRTVRTKGWMNEHLPFGYHVYAEKSVWWIRKGYREKPVLFQDGIRIGPRGAIHNARGPSLKSLQKLKKQVDEFSTAFVEKMFKGEIAAPGNADCWYCLMKTQDGQTLGDSSPYSRTDHLLSHLKDKYYVPSLLYNALKEIGYVSDVESRIWAWPLAKYWGNQEVGNFSYLLEGAKTRYTCALRRYLYRRLEISANPVAFQRRK